MKPFPKYDAAALAHGFRSGLEGKVAAQLTRLGLIYTYEEERIDYDVPARGAKYTPDFVLLTRGAGKKLYIETKGRFEVADRQKHLLIRAQRPTLDIRLVFSNPNQTISKLSKTRYADWCIKHSFIYAKGLIPEGWLDE